MERDLCYLHVATCSGNIYTGQGTHVRFFPLNLSHTEDCTCSKALVVAVFPGTQMCAQEQTYRHADAVLLMLSSCFDHV